MSQTVLITGASRGIGAATARRFAAGGYQVAVNYFQSQAAAEALCRELGNDSFPIQTDVADPDQVRTLVETAMARMGHLDVLVCNAGICLPGMLLQDVTDAQWDRLMAVDAGGVFYTARTALPHMLHRHAGRIITVSSMWGQVGGACEVAYSAAKGAVIAFTKALAKEVAPSGILVNCVAPGVIDTEMLSMAPPEARAMLEEETPIGRLGQPSDIAEAVFYLASPASSFLTGQVIAPNGGLII
ncbi:MAG: 3-oxoacyl-ACP reductase FabG [Candidatus Onthomonas sp.]|nr:3-oxoacyl-ACP reductase FabG [Candidatus Onthomonas sp.]